MFFDPNYTICYHENGTLALQVCNFTCQGSILITKWHEEFYSNSKLQVQTLKRFVKLSNV